MTRRTAWDRQPNRLTSRLLELRASGTPPLDLTESNPTRCGFDYPWDAIRSALGRIEDYSPEPLGLPEAREAVSAWYRQRRAKVDPGQVMLTCSTSEAYSFLFKLLCDPGDEVLVPNPSYPLFDFLTGLDSVGSRSYPLAFDGSWRLDVDVLRARACERTRAILIVNPGNPTGAFLKRAEWEALDALAAERGWAVIVDEVFADYGRGHDEDRVTTVSAMESHALTFALSGLSKVACLPQLKLAWTAVLGPANLKDEALARLELLADAYLSVATPVQRGLPRLLSLAAELQRQVRTRVEENRGFLNKLHSSEASWSVLPSEGGWSAVLRVPSEPPEEERCMALLNAGVLVHPGYFFDFPKPGHLVVSLLTDPQTFGRGAALVSTMLSS